MTDSNSYGLVSAESHVVEPPDLFSSRLPARLKDSAPKPTAGGTGWEIEGLEPVALPATAGDRLRVPACVARQRQTHHLQRRAAGRLRPCRTAQGPGQRQR